MNAPQEQPKRPGPRPVPAWFRQTPPAPAPEPRTPRSDETPQQEEPGYGHGV